MNIQQIRLEGIGNGFRVLNPGDGFRQNDQLWFGKCDTCGETVTSSYFTGGAWEHTVYTLKEYWSKDGIYPNHTSSYKVDYCPTREGNVVEPKIVRPA
jgi:hypothetical protein